jgi:hypothetical protein
MCMRANVIDALLLRREGIVRCQLQRSVKYCLSCMSANQSEPGIALLNKTCDEKKNRQRAPMGNGETKKRRAWDAVVQVAPRSGGSADLVCKSTLHTAVRERKIVGPAVCVCMCVRVCV